MNLTLEWKSIRVIVRFGVRMAILAVFAAFGSIGFTRSLILLLWMSAILSTILATIKREGLLDRSLNHWDETTAYVALCCLTIVLSRFET
jgi:hypothetical protein